MLAISGRRETMNDIIAELANKSELPKCIHPEPLSE